MRETVISHPPARDASRTARRLGWALFVLVFAALVLVAHLGFFLIAVTVVTGVLVTGWLFATLGIAGIEVEREVSATEAPIDGWVGVTLRLRNAKDLPAPWLSWEDQLDRGITPFGATAGLASFSAREERLSRHEAHFARRGLYRIGPTVVEATDALGLVRRVRLLGGAVFVSVPPRRVALGQALPLGERPVHEVPRTRSFMEDPSRFLGVRDYRVGDSLRRVHWRATARVQRLQCRVFEPTVLAGAMIAIDMDARSFPRLDLTADADPRVEFAVTSAASVADFILARGQSVGLLSNGGDAAERFPLEFTGATFRRLERALDEATRTRHVDRMRPFEVLPASGDAQAQLVPSALARLVPTRGLAMPDLLVKELSSLPRSLVLVVITPALSHELARALGACRRCGIEAAVVWLSRSRQAEAAAALPRDVRVYQVADEAGLAALGASPL